MFLASIEGNLIGLIVFAVIGVINWLAQKNQESQANRTKPSAGEAPPPTRVGESRDEEERLRKFMEALGLPPNDPPPPRPTVKRPALTSRTPQPPPVPHPERMPRTARGTPPRSAPPPLIARHVRSLDEADAPTLPVEALSLPPLATRAVPEFDTLTSQISAIPQEMAAARAERDAYQERAPARAALAIPLADLLHSRDDLRRAILLREVLGPPRGLPDTEPLRSFR